MPKTTNKIITAAISTLGAGAVVLGALMVIGGEGPALLAFAVVGLGVAVLLDYFGAKVVAIDTGALPRTAWKILTFVIGSLTAVGLAAITVVAIYLFASEIVPVVMSGTADPAAELDADVLLSAALLLVAGWSLVVGALAVFGWKQLLEHIHSRVESSIAPLHEEVAANNALTTGLIFSNLCQVKTERGVSVPRNREKYLKLAMGYTRKAFEKFRSLKDRDHKAIEVERKYAVSVNNLAFLYALAEEPSLARKARRLAEEAREYYSKVTKLDRTVALNTYAQVVIAYHGEAFEDELKAIDDTIHELGLVCESGRVSDSEKENARRHRAVLYRARGARR